MNSNKRQFLKFFGLTVSAIATGQLQAISIEDNYFCNRKLGLSFIIPKGWEVLSYQNYSKIMDESQLDNFDDELEKEIKKFIGTPLVALQSTRITKNHISPMIHIWAQTNNRPNDDPVTVHSESYEGYKNVFKNYGFLSRPKSTLFADLPASHCKVKYTSETKGGFSEPVVLNSYLFPRGPIGNTFNFLDHETGWSDEVTKEVNDFIASVSFALPRS